MGGTLALPTPFTIKQRLRKNQAFPQKYYGDMWATGKLLHNAHDSRHPLAGFLFGVHHIFMLALARLKE